jgi:hypothetical protein
MYEDECRLRRNDRRDAEIWREEFQKECHLRQTGERAAEERGRKKERERIAQQRWAEEDAEEDRYLAERQRAFAAEEAADAKEREAVIKRYGSNAAVLVPCEREKLLKAAVRQWSKFYTTGEPEWTTSIARCVDLATILGRKKLTHVIDAIS